MWFRARKSDLEFGHETNPISNFVPKIAPQPGNRPHRRDETRKFLMDLQQTFIDWNDKKMDPQKVTALHESPLTKIAAAAK